MTTSRGWWVAPADFHRMREERDVAEARVSELSAALRFYADDEDWKTPPGDTWAGGIPSAPIIKDGGERARRVLPIEEKTDG